MRRFLALGLVVASLLGACGDDDNGGGGAELGPPTTGESTEALAVHDGPPPWKLQDEQAARIAAADLPALTAEGSVVHYHAHLDVFYDGREVTVPANVGIDLEARRISPLHTHSDAGVIHIEANEAADFTLGQLLTEWGVKVADGCIADKCGDEVAVFVNGSIQDVSAGDLVITADTQISLVLGSPPRDIPSTYDCQEAPGDACPDVPS